MDTQMRTMEFNEPAQMLPSPQKELFQDGLLEIIFRRRWIVLSTVVTFMVGVFLYLILATPIFRSTARIYVEQTGPRIISDYEGVMTRSNNYLYTQRELIKSTPIVGNVAESLRDGGFRTFENIDNIAEYIKTHTDVAVGRKDDIISVSFDSPYPDEAAVIVNDVIDSYITYHTASKRSTVSEVLKILQKEKVKRDQEVSEKYHQLLDFTVANGVVSFDSNNEHIGFQRLEKLSEALTDAQIETLNAKADYEAIQAMINNPQQVKQYILATSDAARIPLFSVEEAAIRNDLKELREKLKTVLQQSSAYHPAARKLQGKIKEAERELDDHITEFARAYLAILERRWNAVRNREEELYATFCTEKNDVQKLGVKATEYAVLKSELDRTERLCEILDNRIKELNVTEDTGALNISILEAARAEEKPAKPEKAKVAAMAMLMGLFAGCFFALLRDWMDFRLKSAEEISAVLGVPVLGFVPTFGEPQTLLRNGQKMLEKCLLPFVRKFKSAPAAVPLQANSVGVCDKTLISSRGQKVYHDPMSMEAEAYRTIRTAVFFGAYKEQAKRIVITSPSPGDGKSTLVSNLGIAMAQAGQRTIIIDADFRKATQNVIFGFGNETGISNVIAGTDTLDNAIRRTPIEGLHILSCGSEDSNPSEMFNSDGFTKVLHTLAKEYDRILIDSPPVTFFTDSQILAALCDLTVLVLRSDKSTRRASRHSIEALLSVGARILGAVVNDVSHKSRHYGYGYGRYSQDKYAPYGYHNHSRRKSEDAQKIADNFIYEEVSGH